MRTARYNDEAGGAEFGEISIFVAPTFVITVRQGVASELRAARRRLEQRPDLLTLGTASVLWAILGPLARSASREDTAAHDARTAELARCKLSRLTRDDADGYHRVACPAAAGKIR